MTELPRCSGDERAGLLPPSWLADQRGIAAEDLGEQLVANYDRIFSRRPS